VSHQVIPCGTAHVRVVHYVQFVLQQNHNKGYHWYYVDYGREYWFVVQYWYVHIW